MKKISELYNAESKIDLKKIETILNSYISKDIYCFGGGSAAEILMRQVLYKYKLAGFLDNNSLLWGNKIFGIEVMNPECIIDLRKGEYVVLILSKHLNAIKNQLQSYGLEEGIDYFDIYSEFSAYYRIKKFQLSAEKYYDFLERMPEDLFKNNVYKSEKHIGVVCIASMVDWETWYAITIFLILRYQGYNVTLIMDNMKSFDDFIYFDQHAKIAKIYTDYILSYMCEKFQYLDVCFLNEEEREELVDEDLKEIKRLVQVNVNWQNAKFDELCDISSDECERQFEKILENNLKVIKSFFNKNSYDTINVITALHKSRGLYMWEGKRHNIKVTNYDGAGNNTTLCSTDFPTGYSCDIVKIVKENMLQSELKKIIVNKARVEFEKRIHSNKDEVQYGFQLVADVSKNQKYYDVIIPLNVNCDAAALGLDRLFSDEENWIMETIDFILNNTKASIMVREHPAVFSDVWKDERIFRYNTILQERYGNNDRVFFCSGDEKINTYRMIEQCKCVLPYSSTVGVESALLDKPVITHTNVYYSKSQFVYNAESKDQYFDLIKQAIDGELKSKSQYKEEAYIMFYGHINSTFQTEFRETTDVWMNYNFDEVLELEGVDKMMKVFADGIPYSLQKFHEIWEFEKVKSCTR